MLQADFAGFGIRPRALVNASCLLEQVGDGRCAEGEGEGAVGVDGYLGGGGDGGLEVGGAGVAEDVVSVGVGVRAKLSEKRDKR